MTNDKPGASQMALAYSRVLNEKMLPPPRRYSSYREAHCRCANELNSDQHDKCGSCGWLICDSCGECNCCLSNTVAHKLETPNTDMRTQMKKQEQPKLRFKMTDITPEMAKRYLGNNHSNRNIRKSSVAKYKKLMDKGYWHVTGDGITLDCDGNLIDGQHRLLAVIEHGRPVTMLVTRGVSAGAQQYMDSGAGRRVTDNLKMFDGEKHTSLLAAGSRAIQLFDTGDFTTPVLDEVRAIVKKYRKSFTFMQENLNKSLPRTAYFFAPIVWLHHHGWDAEAEMFLSEMSTLEGLYKGSPVIALTKALDRKAGNAGHYYKALSISTLTFNAFWAYTEEESLPVAKLKPAARGFDHFNSMIKTGFDKRRTSAICSWKAGCTFKKSPRRGGGPASDTVEPYDYCWFHEHVKVKRNTSD